jgi:hypothetical protein
LQARLERDTMLKAREMKKMVADAKKEAQVQGAK